MTACIPRGFAALAIAASAVLSGCATPVQPLYAWGDFSRLQYDALRREGTSEAEQIQQLEAHAAKVRGMNAALPPGFRAHLGLLQLNAGNASRARELWQAEAQAFPESAPYMTQLLARLDGPAKPAAAKNPKTPA